MHFVPPVSAIVPATRNLVSNDDLVVVANGELLRVVLSKRVLCLVALVPVRNATGPLTLMESFDPVPKLVVNSFRIENESEAAS
jgi:hypothetical protein